MGPCCQTRPGKANRSKTNIPCVQLPVMAISPIRQRHVVLPAIHLDLDSGQSGFWLAIARRQRRVLAFRYEDHRRASGLTLRSAAKAECKDSTRTELWSTSCSPSRASSRFTAMIGGSWKVDHTWDERCRVELMDQSRHSEPQDRRTVSCEPRRMCAGWDDDDVDLSAAHSSLHQL
ncbi:hypothetical protein VTJ04DRAFT_2658 [Mycothermus thermophilus]|uniref:uncharacterized protein n=1 Tax=Humicola insolens TaxID=85995 RepID=UPI0037446922